MASGGINLPGTLTYGDLKTTTTVSIGKGGTIVIDNTGTGAAGSVAVAGAMTSTGPLNVGTNPLTCGALACGAVTASGTLSSGAITSSGAFSCGTSSLTSGAITSSGAFSNGTSSLACGAVSCASVTSTGPAASQRWWVRAVLTADQTLSTGVNTAVSFPSLEAVGGTSSNFATSLPQSTFTIPQAGQYWVGYNATFAANVTGQRQAWVVINGGARRWGDNVKIAVTGGLLTACVGSFVYTFAASDTVVLQALQNSGGNLALTGTGTEVACLHIVRLSE